jgi:hypothetical protein
LIRRFDSTIRIAYMLAVPETDEVLIRFLRRFADLVSVGHNAEHLLRSADRLEGLVATVKNLEEFLHEQRIKSQAEIDAARAQQQLELNEVLVSTAAKEELLLGRVERAETRLATVDTELAKARDRLRSDTHLLVPISALRHAEAQFDALAREVNGLVSKVMCEVGAFTLGHAIESEMLDGISKLRRTA